MERKYVRQYQNYDTIIPNMEEFQFVSNNDNEIFKKNEENSKEIQSVNNINLKTDDIILLALIALFLFENNGNMSTVLILGFLFLSEYIKL